MTSGNKKKLFGTDGIRSRFGEFPFDRHALISLGSILANCWQGKKILMGRDTRESGPNIESIIAAGMADQAEVYSCGVIPTPGLSYLLGHSDFDYGLMITASHNPFHDNGIKIFQADGEKISGELENRIEDAFYSRYGNEKPEREQSREDPIRDLPCALTQEYRQFLLDQSVDLDTLKLKCILDCAHGATVGIAPLVFRETGLDMTAINTHPDGRNINDNCGSTDLRKLKTRLVADKADLGIAFDGDGDRVIFLDNQGFELDGDYVLVMISDLLLNTNPDFNKTVVGTIMSNLGLEMALKQRGIALVRTGVGDRLVYEEMKKRNAVLGGEQSGHIILRDFQKTGDGILTALLFLRALMILDMKIGDVRRLIVPQAQVTENIPIKKKRELRNWDELNRLINGFNHRHGDNSRLVIRYSGTESLIRIMMESKHEQIISENLHKFVDLIKSNIGE